MNHSLSFLAAATWFVNPLAAELVDSWEYPADYNVVCKNECQGDYSAEIDFLVWYANQEGLSLSSDYQVTNSPRSDDFKFSTAQQKDHFFKNNWNKGIRGVIGYKPPLKHWDVRATYLNFSTSAHSSTAPKSFFYSSNDSLATGGSYVVGDYYNSVYSFSFIRGDGTLSFQSHWKINVNQADLELGREFSLSRDITLRPFFGMRGLWIGQNIQSLLTYRNLSIASSLGHDILQTFQFDPRARFDGFGARAGLEGSFNIWRYFDLYGSFAANLLWGRAKVLESFTNNAFNIDSATGSIVNQFSNHSHFTTSLNLDVGIGIRWNVWLDRERSLVTIKFGWEEHLYTNMNQLQSILSYPGNSTPLDIPNVDNNVYRGDLSLSGFIAGLSYLF